MSPRSTIASIVPTLAVVATGVVATAPAQAATTYVTAATAGTKSLGTTTYMWGTSNAPAGARICSQVLVSSNWSTSQCTTVQRDHSYTVELTYGKNTPGSYTFRAVTGNVASSPVVLTRGSGGLTPTKPSGPSTTTPGAPSAVVMYATGTVNVRSGPSTSNTVVTTLSANTKVTGTVSGTWLKIASPSNLAGKYVSTTALTSALPTSSTPTPPSTSASIDYIKGRTTDGYVLAPKYNGTKVYLVRKALGVATGPTTSTMDRNATTAVVNFQKKHTGLRTDGVVDAATFYAIKDYAQFKSYLAKYNFDIDAWEAPSQVAAGATHADRIKAMVAFAEDQYGKPYVWGGTGPFGFDCSGLMLQALRAGGYEPKNVTNYTDVRAASDLSNQMWLDKEFPKGALRSLQVGDLIYYSDGGVVHHVSMYVGGGRVINATGTKVQYSTSSDLQGHGKQIGVNRMP